jgi:hypothetical protein
VVPIQHSGGADEDALLVAVRKAAVQGRSAGLTVVELDPLDWPDLEDDIFPFAAAALHRPLLRSEKERLRDACDTVRADPGGSYSALADTVARVIETLERSA